jgi:sec-independent protein translocase protein TatC
MLAVPMWVLFEVGLLACAGLRREGQAPQSVAE